jgi:hypothetical protein
VVTSKRHRRPGIKRSAPATPRPGAKSKPFLRFYHSQDLRRRTLAALSALERSPDSAKNRDALADIAVELAEAGMDYYFLRTLKLAKTGFIIEQSASLGVAGALQIIGTVIRNIIGRMDGPQLLSVCGSIRKLMT